MGFEVLPQSGAGIRVAFEFGAKFADAEEVGGDFAGGAAREFAHQRNGAFAGDADIALEDAPSFLQESLKAGGMEFDIGGGEAFADLTGDAEEDIGDIYVGHNEIFAGVEIDYMKAFAFEVVLEFAEFGGFAAADVSGEELMASIFAGNGAIEFIDEADGCASAASGSGEVNVVVAIDLVGDNEGFVGVAGLEEFEWVEVHRFVDWWSFGFD